LYLRTVYVIQSKTFLYLAQNSLYLICITCSSCVLLISKLIIIRNIKIYIFNIHLCEKWRCVPKMGPMDHPKMGAMTFGFCSYVYHFYHQWNIYLGYQHYQHYRGYSDTYINFWILKLSIKGRFYVALTCVRLLKKNHNTNEQKVLSVFAVDLFKLSLFWELPPCCLYEVNSQVDWLKCTVHSHAAIPWKEKGSICIDSYLVSCFSAAKLWTDQFT